MSAALSQPRTHLPKGHVVGELHADSGWTSVASPRGQHFRALGRADSNGVLWLAPEEALYLLERGSLDVLWRVEGPEVEGQGRGDGKGDDALQLIPLSLQSAYALLIGKLGLTVEKYLVYAGLKRSGYMVYRAPVGGPDGSSSMGAGPQSPSLPVHGAWLPLRLLAGLWRAERARGAIPLVRPGLYRNYSTSCRVEACRVI